MVPLQPDGCKLSVLLTVLCKIKVSIFSALKYNLSLSPVTSSHLELDKVVEIFEKEGCHTSRQYINLVSMEPCNDYIIYDHDL